jgi:hypothetical protein
MMLYHSLMVWRSLAYVFGSLPIILIWLWIFFLSSEVGNMSSRRKYDLSWGEGVSSQGGLGTVFTHTSTVSSER